MMRKKFIEELEQLNVELVKMGSMCEDGLSVVIETIEKPHFDAALMEKAAMLEEDSDKQEKKIESMCLKLIFSQQPVASDLRLISSVLKMISDLERIADQTLDIMHLLEETENLHGLSHPTLNEMAKASYQMLKDSVESFIRRDVNMAKQVYSEDNKIDDLFLKIKEDVIKQIGEEKEMGESLVDVLMMAKYFERIGDHSVNIAEWVTFAVGEE